MSVPLEVFCCYAREDQPMLTQLKKHLAPLERQGQIVIWSDTNLNAGVEWEHTLHQHLERADIILLLISPDFIASDYCYSTEMGRAITRHHEGAAVVIPILLRATFWHNAPFARLQMVPTNARPVTSWPDHDDGFHDITLQVNQVVSERHQRIAPRPPVPPTGAAHTPGPHKAQARQVFVSSPPQQAPSPLHPSTSAAAGVAPAASAQAYNPAADYNQLLQVHKPKKAAEIVKFRQLQAMRESMLTQYPWNTVVSTVHLGSIPVDWSVYFYNPWIEIGLWSGGILAVLCFIVLEIALQWSNVGMIIFLVVLGGVGIAGLALYLLPEFSKLQNKDFVVLLPRGFIKGTKGEASDVIDYAMIQDLRGERGSVIVTLPETPRFTKRVKSKYPKVVLYTPHFAFTHFTGKADLIRQIEHDYLRWKRGVL
ncbi:MAG: toll/interleukin-1 receptor domain-containing protein [Ktedonobacteraceae bacterium]